MTDRTRQRGDLNDLFSGSRRRRSEKQRRKVRKDARKRSRDRRAEHIKHGGHDDE